MDSMKRRDFIEFIGGASLSVALGTSLPGCISQSTSSKKIVPLEVGSHDQLVTHKELDYYILNSYGDSLGRGKVFGFNCDYNCIIPLPGKSNEALLWTNHEFIDPYFVNLGQKNPFVRSKEQVELEQKMVGGSICHIKNVAGQWTVLRDSHFNARIDGTTPIPFSGGAEVLGAKTAKGTLANCAGGRTPWNTVLTCEENYEDFYGEVSYEGTNRKVSKSKEFSWEDVDPQAPEHYGWVVEIDPLNNARAKKLLPLGRFAHESATCVRAKDGRVVVYMGDDKVNECFYKFISDQPDSLESGKLYVANIEKGRWEILDARENPILKKHFSEQKQLLIETRKAAKLAGGTPLDRPEDVEVHPFTKDIYLSCTNNKTKDVFHGSIMRFQEDQSDFTSLTFKATAWKEGGLQEGFSCPDNLCFDPKGNLWMTCDISESLMNRSHWKSFGNNSLFVIPFSGPQKGEVIRVANGPVDSELTGPCFSEDGKTLFLSVQHPGSGSHEAGKLTSHWPKGKNAKPLPSVVAMKGPLLDNLMR